MAKKKPEEKPKKKFGGAQEGSGRPVKELDEGLIFRLAQTMLSQETMADILECSADTLQRRFRGVLQKGRALRKQTLVEAMWQNALEKMDVKMQIWLSKQHLGYKDTLPEEAQQINFNVYTNDVPK